MKLIDWVPIRNVSISGFASLREARCQILDGKINLAINNLGELACSLVIIDHMALTVENGAIFNR